MEILCNNCLDPANHIIFFEHNLDTVRMGFAVSQYSLYMTSCQLPRALISLENNVNLHAGFYRISFLSIHSETSLSVFIISEKEFSISYG